MEPFEFVLVKDDGLVSTASYADIYTFQEQFEESTADPNVCVFDNLGGDATLVCPKPLDLANKNKNKNIYGHLAVFLRKATNGQIHCIWKTFVQTYLDVLSDRSPNSVWLSTAGGGVAWLHFRLDQRPKYYHYDQFRQTTDNSSSQ